MLKPTTKLLSSLIISSTLLFSYDLKDVKESGELRHLGIPYANFITGSGDGLSVELMKGFAKHLNVEYKFISSDWANVFGHLTGTNAINSETGVKFLNEIPIKGDVISNGFTILDWRKEVVAFSTPTFPSGVWLVARADSLLNPIKPSGNLSEDINLVKEYFGNESEYPQYDNYNGINVNKTKTIPKDYMGYIGVPITFLHKYNPDQFDIVKFRKGDNDKDLSINGKCPYFRILIKRKV